MIKCGKISWLCSTLQRKEIYLCILQFDTLLDVEAHAAYVVEDVQVLEQAAIEHEHFYKERAAQIQARKVLNRWKQTLIPRFMSRLPTNPIMCKAQFLVYQNNPVDLNQGKLGDIYCHLCIFWSERKRRFIMLIWSRGKSLSKGTPGKPWQHTLTWTPNHRLRPWGTWRRTGRELAEQKYQGRCHPWRLWIQGGLSRRNQRIHQGVQRKPQICHEWDR